MNRADATELAATLNASSHAQGTVRFSAERSMTAESEWKVVTWQHDKPIFNQYDASLLRAEIKKIGSVPL